MKRIPVAGPSITEREIDLVRDATANAWYQNANVYHDRFERAFAEYVGRRFAMALPSCTSAIHLCLAASGVGASDEVIIPDLTWIASAAPVSYLGATPVFADVDPQTWCMTPDSFRARITPRTKAVIPVDLYGNVPDLPGIAAIAREHGIVVIEDAAEAVGGRWGEGAAGSFGDASTFSFHGSKTLTTGEGGMLVTDDEKLFRRAGVLRDHGRAPGDVEFFNREVAFKYKMSAMQAALGLAQLERIEELVAMKREAFSWYRDELSDEPGVTLNYERPGTRSTYWMVTAILDPALGWTKRELGLALAENGIDTRPFFHPLSSIPAYAELKPRVDNPVARSLSPFGVNLPSSLSLTREEVAYVSETLRSLLRTRSQISSGSMKSAPSRA